MQTATEKLSDHSGPVGITTAADVLLDDREQERRQCGKLSAALAKSLPGVHIEVYRTVGMSERGAAGTVQVDGYRVEIGGATLRGETLEQARNLAFAEVTRVRDRATERKLAAEHEAFDAAHAPERFPFEHQ